MVKLNSNKDPTWFIGIDPGSNGGLAAIDIHGCVRVCKIPDTRLGLADWLKFFRHAESRAVLELNSSSPQMGVVSAFTFGRNCERPAMALTACRIPFEELRPQVWIRALNIPPRKKGGKNRNGETGTQWKIRLRDKAQQLFPNLDVWSETKGTQNAVCDALLIAEYCRRSHLGNL